MSIFNSVQIYAPSHLGQVPSLVTLREPMLRNALYISNKPYILERPYVMGMQDLHELAVNAKMEATWLFNGQSLWYGITLEQFDAAMDGRLSGCKHMLFDFAQIANEVTHIHIHPKKLSYTNVEDVMWKIQGLTYFQAYRIARLAVFATFCMPSAGDFNAYQRILDFHQRSPVKIKFKVVSELGVMEIIFLSKNANIFKQLEQARAESIVEMQKEYFSNPIDEQRMAALLVKIMNQKLKGLATLIFTPG